MSKKFYRIENPIQFQKFDETPWEVYQEPFRMAPHVYYVSGNDNWAVYLIDTGDGLILIDTSMSNVLYLLIDSIYKMGFNLRDIKKILLSHGHPDHDGGARQLKELTGAEIYISKEDWEYKKGIESVGAFKVAPYEVDHFYDDNTPITLGNISIKTKLCPGHSPGTTSFFFVDKDEIGREYKVGMHGGVGIPTKIDPKDSRMPISSIPCFISDCSEMKDWDIDICLPSHTNQINLLENVPEDKMDFSPFVDKDAWRDLMIERIETAGKLLKMQS